MVFVLEALDCLSSKYMRNAHAYSMDVFALSLDDIESV